MNAFRKVWVVGFVLWCALVLATPHAQAQVDFTWNDPAGGDFNDPGNWDSFFPGSVPDNFVRTIFDLPDAYTVDFPDSRTTLGATVRDGNVTFDLQANTYTINVDLIVAELANNVADLTIVNGTVEPDNAVIGEADPSVGALTVGDDGLFKPGSLRIGNHGTGTLIVEAGGRTEAGLIFLGNELTGDGTLRIEGADASGNRSTVTSSGRIQVGRQNQGTLEITGGGLLTTNPDTASEQSDNIGLFPAPGSGLGADGDVTVDGVAPDGTPSTWTSTGPLRMGNTAGSASARGRLTITNGGQAAHTEATLLGSTDFPTQVHIQGTDPADSPSKWTLSDRINADGEILVEQGGALDSANGVVLGQITDLQASLTITGASPSGVRSAYTGGGITVASNSTATLTVADGAILNSPGLTGSLSIASQETGDGTVLITGKDAADNPSTATFGRTVTIGNQGTASLTVSEGGQLTTGFDDPLSFGFVAVSETSDATILITGPGSSWTHARNLFVGGGGGTAGGTANLTVDDGATLDVGLTLKIWNTATANLNGGLLRVGTLDLTAPGTFNMTGGTLAADTVDGDLTNQSGTLAPGESPGTTNITGTYTQQAGASITIEVVSATTPVPGTDADFVNISGVTTLAGSLDVIPLPDPGGFSAPLGTLYQIMAFPDRGGSNFDTTTGTVVNNALALAPLINDTNVTLRASVPGDTNFDDTVSVADLSTFALNFNTAPGVGSFHLGDFNGDGAVTVADLSLLALNFGFGLPPGGSATPLSVQDAATIAGIDLALIPEPTTATTIGLVGLLGRLKRRQPG